MRALAKPVSPAASSTHPIGELQPLQHRLGVPGDPLVLRVGVLGPARSAPARPCRTGAPGSARGCPCRGRRPRGGSRACRPRSRTAARSPSRISSRWMLVTGTSAVGIRKRSSAGDAVEVLLELGQLTGAGQRGAVHQVGRRDFGVAVLPGVQIEHEAGEGAAPAARRAPRKSGKPEPVILAPAGRSRMPSVGGQLPVRLAA